MRHKIDGLEKTMRFEYLWPERDTEAEEKVGVATIIFKPLSEEVLRAAIAERGGVMVCLDEDEAMYCALWRRHQLEKEHPKLARLRFLYDSYECTCWWFEVFETWRKLMLTSGLIFFSPGSASQIVISILICLVSMRVYSGFKPFINDKDDKLAETAQWQLFFTLFGALMLRVDVTNEYGNDRDAFGDILVAFQCIMPVLIIYQSFLRKGKKGDEGDEEASNELTSFFGNLSKQIGVDAVLETVQANVVQVGNDLKNASIDLVGGDALGLVGEAAEIVERTVVKVGERVLDFAKDIVAEVKQIFEKGEWVRTWKRCMILLLTGCFYYQQYHIFLFS